MINHPPPWVKLGASVQDGETTPSWLTRAGLDFKVEKKNVFFYDEDKGMSQIPNSAALVRSDNKMPLSLVSQNRYKVVQPMDIINLYQDIAKAGHLKLEAGGALRQGKVIWALASTGTNFSIEGDNLKEYCLLSTGFDGKATKGALIARRDSCWNTIEIAMRKGVDNVNITHAQVFDPNQIALEMGFTREDVYEYIYTLKTLATEKVSNSTVREYFRSVYFEDINAEDLTNKQMEKIENLMFVYTSEPTQTNITNTMWGALNAVTFTQDHLTAARSDDNRLNSAWFGQGRNIKNNAFNKAVALLN